MAIGDQRDKEKQCMVDIAMEGDTENNTGVKQEELRVQAELQFKKQEQLMEAERKEREEAKEREWREKDAI